MIKKLTITLLCFLALLYVCHAEFVEISGTINETNNTWGPAGSGALVSADMIILTDDIVILEGTTLTILPGTSITVLSRDNHKLSQINLFSGIEIANYGKVAAFGTAENPIHFKGIEEKPSSWQGFFSVGTLTLHNVVITDAACAVTASGGSLQVSNCSFWNNKTAIMLWGWQDAKIQQSLIKDNVDGISCASTPALIVENTISGNQVGIRILQGESGPVIIGNSFENNTEYHIYNLSVTDIRAYPNTWDMPYESLSEKLFDGRVEPEAGVIFFDPEDL